MAKPDYNNDLAFEPKITFQDLCTWVKAQNYPSVSVEDEFKGSEKGRADCAAANSNFNQNRQDKIKPEI